MEPNMQAGIPSISDTASSRGSTYSETDSTVG